MMLIIFVLNNPDVGDNALGHELIPRGAAIDHHQSYVGLMCTFLCNTVHQCEPDVGLMFGNVTLNVSMFG
jgi:hypothetical protein